MARLSAAEQRRHEQALADAMAEVTRRLSAKVSDHLRSRSLSAAAEMPAEWWDAESARDEAESRLLPAIRDAAIASGAAVALALAKLGYFGDDALDRFVRDHAGAQALLLIDTIHADLQRRIRDGVDDAKAADLVDEYAADSRRPWVTAAYVVALAANFGAVQGGRVAEQANDGYLATKEWVLGPAHDEGDECDELAGTVVQIDDSFGSNGDPPAHWGCNCYLDIQLVAEMEIAASAVKGPTNGGGTVEAMETVTFDAQTIEALRASAERRGWGFELGALTAAADGSVTVTKGKAWHSRSLVEGFTTSDGREFAPGSVKTRALPLPVMGLDRTTWGHDTAVLVGAIETATRESDGAITTTGWFDVTAEAEKFEGYVDRQTLRWVSVDVEVFDYEIVFDDEDDLWDLLFWSGENRRGAARRARTVPLAKAEALAVSRRAGGKVVDFLAGDNRREQSAYSWVERYLDAALMGLTICPFPAFPQAVITLADRELPAMVDADTAEGTTDELGQAGPTPVLVAAAAPETPPAEWFDDPRLDRPTCVTITPEGRVYGHLARWDRAHISYLTGEKIYAPRNAAVYSRFCKGATECVGPDGAVEVRTGRIVIGPDHAGHALSFGEATRFYANACAAVANVAMGIDEFGPWVAGSIDPGASPEQVRLFKACGSISGDWRPNRDEGGYRLAGILVVNEPGFPIDEELTALAAAAGLDHVPTVRPTVHVHEGQVTALVAAGALGRRDVVLGHITDLRREVATLRSVVDQLRPLAAERMTAPLRPVATG